MVVYLREELEVEQLRFLRDWHHLNGIGVSPGVLSDQEVLIKAFEETYLAWNEAYDQVQIFAVAMYLNIVYAVCAHRHHSCCWSEGARRVALDEALLGANECVFALSVNG